MIYRLIVTLDIPVAPVRKIEVLEAMVMIDTKLKVSEQACVPYRDPRDGRVLARHRLGKRSAKHLEVLHTVKLPFASRAEIEHRTRDGGGATMQSGEHA
jgi:hypothetical protein